MSGLRLFVLTMLFLLLPLTVLAGDPVVGKNIYTRHCMGCHGASGAGMMPGLPNFSRGEQLFKSDNELMDTVRNGNGVMPSFGGLISEEEIRDVVAYLRTFL
ncbi:MAG: cytochrome c [Gammaproteobacteria bacterium]|nr:cytochrome c [Gammaproteobacteria bacterium]MDH5730988.1 cytochrome c [Gammaproteobacteria bacterium]